MRTPLFTCHHWTVTINDDTNYDVLDEEGDVQDECTNVDDAIEACRDQAEAAYRERLWAAIQDADPEGLPLYILQAVADSLGLNAQTI